MSLRRPETPWPTSGPRRVPVGVGSPGRTRVRVRFGTGERPRVCRTDRPVGTLSSTPVLGCVAGEQWIRPTPVSRPPSVREQGTSTFRDPMTVERQRCHPWAVEGVSEVVHTSPLPVPPATPTGPTPFLHASDAWAPMGPTAPRGRRSLFRERLRSRRVVCVRVGPVRSGMTST